MSSLRIRIITMALLAIVALALTLAHGERVAADGAERAADATPSDAPVRGATPASGATLAAELGCAACHLGVGTANRARAAAPALGGAGDRYTPGYLFAALAGSVRARADSVRARMPDFHLDDRERLALTLYLGALHGSGSAPSRRTSERPGASARQLDAELARVRKANPQITAAMGERIFTALDCAGCHAMPAGASAAWLSGPDLSTEGSRARPDWLRAFLARPHPVRPFGAHPGTGSRMPDFHLTTIEADSLAAWLGAKRASLPAFEPPPLSAFAQREAESLMRDKLPCLGCHRLGREGGRIGPDLSNVRERLQPAYIHAMISDPQHAAPGTIMPRTPMPTRTLELVATYLATRQPARTDSASAPRYLSLVDNAPIAPTSATTGPALYQQICANCHGTAGKGDGWNARYLPVRPTMHADATYMSSRPDGTIYDGIAAGGAILNRSNRMPAFREMLSRAEIRSLVAYIRALCGCEGPAWSRDGATR